MQMVVSVPKRSAIVEDLQRCRLFAQTPALVLDELAAITVREFVGKDEYLFREGDLSAGFFVIQSGAIKLHRTVRRGKQQVIHVYLEHESFGEEALIPDLGYSADASATEDSWVLMVQKDPYLDLLKRYPDLALHMLRSMNEHLCLLVGRLDDLTLKDVKTRLAAWLLEHCPDPDSVEPVQIRLPMPKHMLASQLGTMSETFSRTLAKFRDQKLISIHGRTVVLLCPLRLSQLLRCGFGKTSVGIPAHWFATSRN